MNNIFPITAAIALFLFIVKELLDLLKKRAERLRKIQAIKILLAEELEKNYWTFRSMFRILDEIQIHEESDTVKFYMETSRNGTELFRKKDDYGISGSGIPKFQTSTYEKLLLSLAELDIALFEIVRDTYAEIIELAHYREVLIDFLSGSVLDEDDDIESNKAFLSQFADEKDDSYHILNEGYKALTGNNLKVWRLR